MGLPISNVMSILSSGSELEKRRNETIRLAIFVEKSAPDALVETLRTSFFPELSGGLIHVEVFDAQTVPTINDHTDCAVIVACSDPATGYLFNHLKSLGVPAVVVAPAVDPLYAALAGQEVSFGGALITHTSPSELLSPLATWILDHIQEDKQLAFAANFPFIRRALATSVINETARQNALVGGVAFIPGADFPVMTANQGKMLLELAAIYGQKLGAERIRELAVAVGGGFALRAVARQVVGLVPALGWAVKAGIGYSGTLAMGKAALEYFEQGGDLHGLAGKVTQMRASLVDKAKIAAQSAKEKGSETGSSFIDRVTAKARGEVSSQPVDAEDVESFRL